MAVTEWDPAATLKYRINLKFPANKTSHNFEFLKENGSDLKLSMTNGNLYYVTARTNPFFYKEDLFPRTYNKTGQNAF